MGKIKVAIAIKTGLSEQGSSDDWLLKAALEAQGVSVDLVDWRNKSVDFSQYDSIFVSSTWNAHYYPEEFLAWIEQCDSDRQRLINSAEVLKLHLYKNQYLTPLLQVFGDKDSPEGSVTPSLFLISLNEIEDLNGLRQNNSVWKGDLVVKPIVSASGNDTFVFTHDPNKISKIHRPFSEIESTIEKILAKSGSKGVIIQPFMPFVEQTGEYQLVFIGQKLSHATVKPTGFNNTNMSQRKMVPVDELPKGMLEFAEKIMGYYFTKYPDSILRTRLDFFAGENGPILCEAEMIEPVTNIKRLPHALQDSVLTNYATAIVNHTLKLKVVAALKDILGDESTNYAAIEKHPEVCRAFMKIYDTHREIISHLEHPDAKEKLKLALNHSPEYLNSCCNALNTFAQKASPQPSDKKMLMRSLDAAKQQYCQSVLSKDRTPFSKFMRVMLKGVVNFIAGLSLGIAHGIHYRKTGTAAFFDAPASESKLKQAHHELNDEIKNIQLNPSKN